MITRFMTEVNAKFNPFLSSSRPTRLFLACIPPTARFRGTRINTKLLSRMSEEESSLQVKFKDGKVMDLNASELGIKGIIEELDRHSRSLQKQADLTD